jgi:oligopeptide/dipeptide ABC transporter ATP-binding protein
VKAVDNISFETCDGEILGVAGESGSGKTTIARLLTLLETATCGEIRFQGRDIFKLDSTELKAYRKNVQMVFQDPYSSIDPLYSVYRTLYEPLAIHNIGHSKDERKRLIFDILERVELEPDNYTDKRPHQLSGGERQRIAIARALILGPSVLIADEPVSMLDASVRAAILNLLLKISKESRTTDIVIAHDLHTLSYISNRIFIMYSGKIVEKASTNELVSNPIHPYTKLLFSTIPILKPGYRRPNVKVAGQDSVWFGRPEGCIFHPRCPCALDLCKKKEPTEQILNPQHTVACHMVE